MKNMPNYLRTAVLAMGLGSVFLSGCDLSIKDPDGESEREEFSEIWTSPSGTSTYSYVKCTTSTESNSSRNLCGTRLGQSVGSSPSYNWHTNCADGSCGTVSVFAHYMLSENLGPQQTLRIEAFDNPQFTNAPVASLEISGFDASKPSSTGLEEIYLAPGEYYFRAYLTHGSNTPVPYSLQGMELVSETPVGVLGALSGAQRVLVKSAGSLGEAVHIYIDQLFKKAEAPEDTLAKFRLQITLTDASKAEKYRNVHILVLKDADLELNPLYDFTVSSNNLLADGLNTDFVSPSLTPGSYYIFTYIDSNSNGFADAGEQGSFLAVDGKPSLVVIDKNKTKSLSVSLSTLLN